MSKSTDLIQKKKKKSTTAEEIKNDSVESINKRKSSKSVKFSKDPIEANSTPSTKSKSRGSILKKKTKDESVKEEEQENEDLIKIGGDDSDSEGSTDDDDDNSGEEGEEEDGGRRDDDYDSQSDEESVEFDIKTLPDPKEGSKNNSKNNSNQPTNKEGESTGVIYLGRIPHGFHEKEMKSYFSQFGTVLRVKLSRNRKTGKSKHYGFVEFQHLEVAKIVAETLDNYLLSGRILSCKVLEKDEVHPKLFSGSGKKFKKDWKPRLAREKHNQEKSPSKQSAIAHRLMEREKLKRKKLEELGINYEFKGYCNQDPKNLKRKERDANPASNSATDQKDEKNLKSNLKNQDRNGNEGDVKKDDSEKPKKKKKKNSSKDGNDQSLNGNDKMLSNQTNNNNSTNDKVNDQKEDSKDKKNQEKLISKVKEVKDIIEQKSEKKKSKKHKNKEKQKESKLEG